MRNEKRTFIEYLQKINKEIKKIIIDLKRQYELKNDKGEVFNNDIFKEGDNKEFIGKVESGLNETKNKDLKLSFMEKLNLIFFFVKKQFVFQDNQYKIINIFKFSGICDVEFLVQVKIVICVFFVSEYIIEEIKLKVLELNDVFVVEFEFRIKILERKMEEENSLLVKFVENIVFCDVFFCGIEIFFLVFVEMEKVEFLFLLLIEME